MNIWEISEQLGLRKVDRGQLCLKKSSLKKYMTIFKKLEALLLSSDVSDYLKRRFAADCAERAMFARTKRTCEEPIPEWWDLMDTLCKHAEGKVTAEVLTKRRETYLVAIGTTFGAAVAYHAAHGSAYATHESTYWAYEAASWAAHMTASYAAYYAAYRGAYEAVDRTAEREWQLCQFKTLIEQHNQQRASLLAVLLKRNKRISSDLSKVKGQLEEVLFT